MTTASTKSVSPQNIHVHSSIITIITTSSIEALYIPVVLISSIIVLIRPSRASRMMHPTYIRTHTYILLVYCIYSTWIGHIFWFHQVHCHAFFLHDADDEDIPVCRIEYIIFVVLIRSYSTVFRYKQHHPVIIGEKNRLAFFLVLPRLHQSINLTPWSLSRVSYYDMIYYYTTIRKYRFLLRPAAWNFRRSGNRSPYLLLVKPIKSPNEELNEKGDNWKSGIIGGNQYWPHQYWPPVRPAVSP